jgi:hypothetical protein
MPYSTQMVEGHALRDRADVEFVGHTMGYMRTPSPATYADGPISVRSDTGGPLPAAVLPDPVLLLESFPQRSRLGSHPGSISSGGE